MTDDFPLEGVTDRDLSNIVSHQATNAAADARRARSEAEELKERVDRLALMTEALWMLLRDRFGMTDDELFKVVQDLDLADGKLDGRASKAGSACSKCKRMVGKRHTKCMYCGTPIEREPFKGM